MLGTFPRPSIRRRRGWENGNIPTHILEVMLRQSRLSMYNMWKRRRTVVRRPPDHYPVNQSLYYGHISNIAVYLRYGFNLDFSVEIYERLVDDVVHTIIMPSWHLICIDELRHDVPNTKRVFLALLVIQTYIKAENSPDSYRGCDEALQTIWNHNPDSFLCQGEFLNIFETYISKERRDDLIRFFERYSARVSMCPDVIQPFSLAHYSRCKVREVMSRNMTLPNGVADLPIPPRTQRYLLFQ